MFGICISHFFSTFAVAFILKRCKPCYFEQDTEGKNPYIQDNKK